MRAYKVEAIILRAKTMREADKIITIFSRERGKQRVVAHGVSKAKSRKRGAVQPLCHSQLLLYKGKELDSVTQAESITYFDHLRQNLEKLAWASYLCELVDGLNAENEPNEPLFILLLTGLKWLNQPETDLAAAEILVSGFEIKMLGLLGYLPELNCCVNCGAAISGKISFSLSQGGLLCDHCRSVDTKLYFLTPQSLDLLKQLIVTKPGGLTRLTPPQATYQEVKRLLHNLAKHHLERRAKALDFLEVLHKSAHFGGKY